MIDREVFFDEVRHKLWKGKMSQSQVDGCNIILDYYEEHPGICTLPQLAYLLATTYHETAQTMQPIAEYGKGKGRKYGIKDRKTGQCYYGRGYVQLTWKDNYERFGKKLDLDLVNNPELAMKPDIAVQILFDGSLNGEFTGASLLKYIRDGQVDFYNARRVINGTDCAQKIAGYAEDFLTALS